MECGNGANGGIGSQAMLQSLLPKISSIFQRSFCLSMPSQDRSINFSQPWNANILVYCASSRFFEIAPFMPLPPV